MGLGKWGLGRERLLMVSILKESFCILTLITLSLLLPLSFLLLSRFSAIQYDIAAFITFPPPPASFLLSFFLHTDPTLLRAIISFISVTTLLRGLTGRFSLSNVSPRASTPILRPHRCVAWIFLCTLQVCVGLGIEGVIASAAWSVDYDMENGTLTLCQIVFFVGLHETMLHWYRIVVKLVVDDTVFGFLREERWVEKVAIGASFGALWWWRLRNEVEVLVHVVQVKRQLSKGLGVADVSWWLYYLTIIIGMVRVGNWIIWAVKALLCRKPEDDHPCSCSSNGDDDKV